MDDNNKSKKLVVFDINDKFIQNFENLQFFKSHEEAKAAVAEMRKRRTEVLHLLRTKQLHKLPQEMLDRLRLTPEQKLDIEMKRQQERDEALKNTQNTDSVQDEPSTDEPKGDTH